MMNREPRFAKNRRARSAGLTPEEQAAYTRDYRLVYNRLQFRAYAELKKRHPDEFREIFDRLALDDPLPKTSEYKEHDDST